MHINSLKSSYQELWGTSFSRDFINFWIDAAAAVLDFMNAAGGVPTLLTTIAGAVGAIKGGTLFAKNFGSSAIKVKRNKIFPDILYWPIIVKAAT